MEFKFKKGDIVEDCDLQGDFVVANARLGEDFFPEYFLVPVSGDDSRGFWSFEDEITLKGEEGSDE